MERSDSTRPDYTIVADGTPGITQAVVDDVRHTPGELSALITPVALYGSQRGSDPLVHYDAMGVDPAVTGSILDLPMREGSLSALTDNAIVVDQEWGKQRGDQVAVIFGDGHRATLTVAAVLSTLAPSARRNRKPGPQAGVPQFVGIFGRARDHWCW